MTRFLFSGFIAMLLTASVANAATITASIVPNGNEYELYAQVTDGAATSQGIAAFNFQLSGLDALGIDGGAVVFEGNALGGVDPNNAFAPLGFGANIPTASPVSDRFGAGDFQPKAGGAPIFDIGEAAVSANTLPVAVALDELAYFGKFILPGGSAPLTAANFAESSFTVFPDGWTGGATELAQTNVQLVPEPSSVAIVGLALAGLVGFARRK